MCEQNYIAYSLNRPISDGIAPFLKITLRVQIIAYTNHNDRQSPSAGDHCLEDRYVTSHSCKFSRV